MYCWLVLKDKCNILLSSCVSLWVSLPNAPPPSHPPTLPLSLPLSTRVTLALCSAGSSSVSSSLLVFTSPRSFCRSAVLDTKGGSVGEVLLLSGWILSCSPMDGVYSPADTVTSWKVSQNSWLKLWIKELIMFVSLRFLTLNLLVTVDLVDLRFVFISVK